MTAHGPDRPRVIIALDAEDANASWRAVADGLTSQFAVTVAASADTRSLRRLLPDDAAPALVVAHGASAIHTACALAAAREGRRIRGLVLVDGAPSPGSRAPAQPTLILRGRQSESFSHRSAISAFERLPAGRIVELESCGAAPQRDQPDALASAIEWFAGRLAESEAASSGE